MNCTTSDYSIAMKEGCHWLRLDRYVRAHWNFTQALKKANDDNERAEALRMCGVVHHLMGRFSDAHKDFEDALYHAPPNSIPVGRIMRDQGLCYLDQARGDEALTKEVRASLCGSYELLRGVHTYEASMTLSCLGEYFLFFEDRTEGMRSLRRAVRELRGMDARYEMNCRLRLAKVSALWRWICAPRAFITGIQTKDGFVELIEYVLLLAGGKRLAGAGRRGLANIQLIMSRK